jgi:hypothetical protein
LSFAQVVHGLGLLNALFDDLSDFITRFLYGFGSCARDVSVQGLVLAREWRPVQSAVDFSLLDRTLASNDNLRPGLEKKAN